MITYSAEVRCDAIKQDARPHKAAWYRCNQGYWVTLRDLATVDSNNIIRDALRAGWKWDSAAGKLTCPQCLAMETTAPERS